MKQRPLIQRRERNRVRWYRLITGSTIAVTRRPGEPRGVYILSPSLFGAEIPMAPDHAAAALMQARRDVKEGILK